MPVGICVQNVGSNKFWRRIGECSVASSDRDDGFGIVKPAFYDVADCELLLACGLTDEARENDNLLVGVVAEEAVDFIPESRRRREDGVGPPTLDSRQPLASRISRERTHCPRERRASQKQ